LFALFSQQQKMLDRIKGFTNTAIDTRRQSQRAVEAKQRLHAVAHERDMPVIFSPGIYEEIWNYEGEEIKGQAVWLLTCWVSFVVYR